jgi:hypothetical protein
MLQKTSSRVRELTDRGPMTRGVKQGCSMSALLFLAFVNFVAQLVARRLKERDIHGLGWQVPSSVANQQEFKDAFPSLIAVLVHLFYADDCKLVAGTRHHLQLMLDVTADTLSEWALIVSHKKTEVLKCAWADDSDQSPIRLYGRPVSMVDSLLILGSLFSSDASCLPDIIRRRDKAKACFYALLHVWRDKNISLTLKRHIFTCSALEVLLYGAECWTVRCKELDVLEGFIGDCSRVMLRGSRWEAVTHETYRIRAGLDRAEFWVRNRRLQWLGHVLRMSYNRWARIAYEGWPAQSPKCLAGRGYTWHKHIAADCAALKIRVPSLLARAQNRSGWRRLSKTPLALPPIAERMCKCCGNVFRKAGLMRRHMADSRRCRELVAQYAVDMANKGCAVQ